MATQPVLQGRHVVVTGAAGEVGPTVVTRLLEAGATCHALQRLSDGRTPDHPQLRITSGIDLTDEGAVAAYYGSLPPLWASVHLAGGYGGAPVAETALAAARKQLDINFFTAFLCCREAVRNLRRGGGGGRIVNFASRAALQPAPGAALYSASKAAVAALTQALAQEVRDDGIRVNALAPNSIDTPANRAAMPKADPTRWIKPSEVADAVLWLVSPDASAVNGAIIPLG